jgi:molecular chaperone Hsp33
MLATGTENLTKISDKKLGDFGFAGDDTVVPFEVASLDVRGRVVQLGSALDAILARHNYPEPVSRLLAEAAVLTVLLGASLKFDGKLILQTRSDGPVDMLVVDFTTPSALRAYARFDADRVAAAVEAGETSAPALLGNGVLAFTIDQGEFTQRYQGIVELNGQSLDEVARAYFRQSEQIPTDVRLAVARQVTPGDNGSREAWRAGGLLLQFLPEAPERQRASDLHGGDGAEVGEAAADDAWNEATALLNTVEASELLDPTVEPERLLYRLFHEHGVRVFEGTPIIDQCTCSRERVKGILSGFTAEEIRQSTEDGAITVACEFCSTAHTFDPAEFNQQGAAGSN